MAPRAAKRRTPGEGGAFSYKIKTRTGDPADKGVRWGWKATLTMADGTRKPVLRRRGRDGQPFLIKDAALADMHDAIGASRKGGFTEPSKMLLASYLATWLDGLRLAPSTVASYRKNVRLHISPRIGAMPLAQLTPIRLDALYRDLEAGGRADRREGEGLSPRTVRYIHTIISGALRDAVEAGLLEKNPAAKAHPPTTRQAKAPEMHPWTAAQLAAFLAWSAKNSPLHAAWHVLAMTGMRRGELLALRWRDVDLDTGTISVRRSVGVVKIRGQHEQITEGTTKTGRSRVIDVDPGTVAVLRSWKAGRGSLALPLAKPDALVFGNIEGRFRHPETFSKMFIKAAARCRRDLGDDAVPAIRLHDLRHTHATILQVSGVASAASFGRSGERVLPAVQRAALEQARSHGSPCTRRDLRCHHPLSPTRTMMQPVRLQQIPA